MPASEIIFLKVFLPILKSLGICWFLQRRNKAKLCRLMSEIARDYSDAPNQAVDMYTTLIVLFRHPMIRENNEITINTKKIYEVDRVRRLHEKCTDAFSSEQNRSIEAVLERASKINNDINNIDLKRENIEEQKNAARQILIDWCFVLFMFGKIGENGSKFKPLNKDPKDFNSVIRERFGVSLDENQLFDVGLSKYGVKIVSAK